MCHSQDILRQVVQVLALGSVVIHPTLHHCFYLTHLLNHWVSIPQGTLHICQRSSILIFHLKFHPQIPSRIRSSNPTNVPSLATVNPSISVFPSQAPSYPLFKSPTELPSTSPSKEPSITPTGYPSSLPSSYPSDQSSSVPTLAASSDPPSISVVPSTHPSWTPTETPTLPCGQTPQERRLGIANILTSFVNHKPINFGWYVYESRESISLVIRRWWIANLSW